MGQRAGADLTRDNVITGLRLESGECAGNKAEVESLARRPERRLRAAQMVSIKVSMLLLLIPERRAVHAAKRPRPTTPTLPANTRAARMICGTVEEQGQTARPISPQVPGAGLVPMTPDP